MDGRHGWAGMMAGKHSGAACERPADWSTTTDELSESGRQFLLDANAVDAVHLRGSRVPTRNSKRAGCGRGQAARRACVICSRAAQALPIRK
jgi:hypothetical protein